MKKAITILLILLCVLSVQKVKSLPLLLSEPTYKTANRWKTDEGKKAELCNLTVSEPLCVSYEVNERFAEGTALIFKAKSLKIKAYTKNKILFDDAVGRGESYVIIPVDEALPGSELTLSLKPEGEGEITSTVVLQTKNDFYFTLLSNSKAELLLAFFALLFFAFWLGKRRLTLSALFLLSALLCLFHCEAVRFFV